MIPKAIEYFKRNPKSKACHVVLDRVFDNIGAATVYKRSVRALKVTSYTRKEYDEWVKANQGEHEKTN